MLYMVTNQATIQKEGFKDGFKEGIGIGISYITLALAYGIAATRLGLNFSLSNLLSALVQSGTAQLTVLNLLGNGETAVFAFLMSIFIVNCRYILFSVSIAQRMAPEMNTFKRILFGFFNTDEIFATAMQKQGKLRFPYLIGLATAPFLGWMLGTALGTLFTHMLPLMIVSALGMAIYGIFVSIIVPAAKKSRPVSFSILLAAIVHLILEYVPVIKQNLSTGNILIITTVVAAGVSALVFPVNVSDDEQQLAEEAGNSAEQL